jgi:hypothetical protein
VSATNGVLVFGRIARNVTPFQYLGLQSGGGVAIAANNKKAYRH